MFELGSELRGDQNHVADAALAAGEAAVRAPRLEGTRHPFLCIEQLVLVADGVTEAHQLLDAAALPQSFVGDDELDPMLAKAFDRRLEFEFPFCFPADVGQPIDLPWVEGDPVAPVVHPEVQRVLIAFRGRARLETHHLGAVFAPGVQVAVSKPR